MICLFYLFERQTTANRLFGICALLVFLVASAIVIVYHDYFWLGDFVRLNNDDVKYVHSARILLNEGTLAYNSGDAPSTFIMPGVPLVLAGFMAIFGQE